MKQANYDQATQHADHAPLCSRVILELQCLVSRHPLLFLVATTTVLDCPVDNFAAAATDRYLRPLQPWLQRIDSEINIKNLPGLFRPALHVVRSRNGGRFMWSVFLHHDFAKK